MACWHKRTSIDLVMEICRQIEESIDSEADVEGLLFMHDTVLTNTLMCMIFHVGQKRQPCMYIFNQLLSAKCSEKAILV